MKLGLLYVLLVVLPVLALVGIVRIGERIMPPPYVGGTWHIIEESAPPPEQTCVPSIPGSELLEVKITQSGTVLEIILYSQPPIRTRARLRGDTLRTDQIHWVPSCVTGWVLEAHIMDSNKRARMAGRWTPVDCDTCATRKVTGTRVSRQEPKR